MFYRHLYKQDAIMETLQTLPCVTQLTLTPANVNRLQRCLTQYNGFTIAIEVEKEAVKFAIARCDKNDTYSRKAGTQIATVLLKTAPHYIKPRTLQRLFSNTPGAMDCTLLNPQIFFNLAFSQFVFKR